MKTLPNTVVIVYQNTCGQVVKMYRQNEGVAASVRLRNLFRFLLKCPVGT